MTIIQSKVILFFMRAAWLIVAAISISLFTLEHINLLTRPLPDCTIPGANCLPSAISQQDEQIAHTLHLPFSFYWYYVTASIFARGCLAAVAIVIFLRRSNDWIAMTMSIALVCVLLEGGSWNIETKRVLDALVAGIGTSAWFILPFTFPDGQVQPTWMRWPMVVVTTLSAISYALTYYESWWFDLAGILFAIWSILAIVALRYRYYQVATAVERQQIKWVILGFLVTMLTGINWTIITMFWPVTQPSVERIQALLVNGVTYVLGYGTLAFGIFVSILRYRLWDIDLIIRRTMQYSVITAILAVVYFGSITILQNLFTVITGQQSPLVVVLSTLTIAALFQPLRQRVQVIIDRRFYRHKYDAQNALAQFAEISRNQTDLTGLTDQLTDLAQQTMQPAGLSLWIRTKHRGVDDE